MFVVTYFNGLALFKKNDSDSDSNYVGMAISCPVDIQYTFCAWNPNGKWLAVNCCRVRQGQDGHNLGLYNVQSRDFVITDINIDHRPIVWKNDHILYVTEGNNVEEIDIGADSPKVIRTILIGEGVPAFYGIFDERPLIQKDNKIVLGEQTLVELQHSSRTAVIVTEKFIFVAQSPTGLIVFDHKGHEISSIDSKERIRFGSVGENSSTAYGVAGSMLLRLFVQDNSIRIDKICDLRQ